MQPSMKSHGSFTYAGYEKSTCTPLYLFYSAGKFFFIRLPIDRDEIRPF